MKRMTRMRTVVLGLLAAGGLLTAAPAGASAQEQIGCFRGKPLPACKTFWIVEMQGLVPMAQTSRTLSYGGGSGNDLYVFQEKAFDSAVEWNLGHMVNVGEGYAVGGVFTLGSGNSDPLTGMRVRGRKWLNDDLSLELEAGLLRNNASGTQFPGLNGWTSGLRLNIRDQGSFFVRYDGVSIPGSSFPYDTDPGGVQHGLSVGAGAGSVPALVGTGSLAVLYALLLALYLGSD